MTTLRAVLSYFETEGGAASLGQMARDLGVERGMLEEMIGYWVRKGRLRASVAACATWGAQGCPVVGATPRRSELVRGDSAPPENCPKRT